MYHLYVYFTIPYVKGISDSFRGIVNGTSDRIAYFSFNKLNDLIRVQKDPLPHTTKKNIVYEIQCSDCDATYVGQTKRMLKTRVNEHHSHIRRNTSSRSVITDHRLQHNHDFEWNNVKIMEKQIYSITTDNGNNMIKAVEIFSNENVDESEEDEEAINCEQLAETVVENLRFKEQNVISVKCAAHTLQLAIKDFFRTTNTDVIDRARQVV
ncbi:hypothetical protein ALC62_14042 [Cyphomyrmex costatus]|uniref:GIY-YIG domain-containing protein n=1 Tax=Cyphomyrmex costatus TaxID=456900 RepID=A0A151I924_9HYME|nr:hypothetical protein ALC62_14042 [Cyphomyrmex costatus]